MNLKSILVFFWNATKLYLQVFFIFSWSETIAWTSSSSWVLEFDPSFRATLVYDVQLGSRLRNGEQRDPGVVVRTLWRTSREWRTTSRSRRHSCQRRIERDVSASRHLRHQQADAKSANLVVVAFQWTRTIRLCKSNIIWSPFLFLLLFKTRPQLLLGVTKIITV